MLVVDMEMRDIVNFPIVSHYVPFLLASPLRPLAGPQLISRPHFSGCLRPPFGAFAPFSALSTCWCATLLKTPALLASRLVQFIHGL